MSDITQGRTSWPRGRGIEHMEGGGLVGGGSQQYLTLVGSSFFSLCTVEPWFQIISFILLRREPSSWKDLKSRLSPWWQFYVTLWEKEDSREPESHSRLRLWQLPASWTRVCWLQLGLSVAAVFVDIFPQWKGAEVSHYTASGEKRVFLKLMEWCLAEQGRFLNTWRWCCLFQRIIFQR